MIVEKFYDYIQKRQGAPYPKRTNSPSILGGECVRQLVYERTHWQKKAPPTIEELLIFQEGYYQERMVKQSLRDAGVEILEEDRPYEYAPAEIYGKIDGKVRADGEREKRILEIKSMSPYIYDKVNIQQDFDKFPWTKKYITQINLYMFVGNGEKGLFVLKNKSTGQMKEIPMSLDYEYTETILKKCEAINKAVHEYEKTKDEKALPDRIPYDEETCSRCKFYHICMPDKPAGDAKIIINPELIHRLEELEKIKPLVSQYEKEMKEIKEMFREVPYTIIGPFEAVGKWIERKEVVIPAGKYWMTTIRKIKK